jgi:periplasmic iron binding protein
MQFRQTACALGAIGALAALSALANAAEFYVGEPVVQDGMQIVPNYLVGIKMDHMPPGAAMGPNSIHLEADVHATKDDKHGFPEDAWIPYLTIRYTLTKDGSKFRKTGKLVPMTAIDGPHYANNVTMNGPGTYHLTYEILPPSSNGFIRHVDQATGVPDWWKPITLHWTFTYPSKQKGK